MENRIEKLLEFLKENPKDDFLNYALASEYIKSGNLNEGLLMFQKLVENSPNYVGTYYHLAKLYEKLGKTEEAIQTYQDGILIARKLKNQHALNELQGALNLLNLEADEDDW